MQCKLYEMEHFEIENGLHARLLGEPTDVLIDTLYKGTFGGPISNITYSRG